MKSALTIMRRDWGATSRRVSNVLWRDLFRSNIMSFRILTTSWRLLAILILLAFCLRFVAAVGMRRGLTAGPGRVLGADGEEFNNFAINLAEGRGYVWQDGRPTAFRAPGFPMFLAGVYYLCGVKYPAAYLSFCLLGCLTCGLTYRLAQQTVGESGAWIAALLAALYLPSVYDATVFASENLFAPLLALTALLMFRHLRTGSLLAMVGAGLSLGWAILTRPFAILLLPIFGAILVYRRWKAPSSLLLATCSLVLSASVVVVPWTIRNYRVFHRVVLVATNGGSTFYGGNNDIVLTEPNYYGGWIGTGQLPERQLVDAAPDEVSHDKVEWDLGLKWVRTHAAWVPLLCTMKFVRFCLPEINSGNQKYVLLQILATGPFLLLVFLGIGICGRNREYWTLPWTLVHAMMSATVLTALIFWGSPRFRDANAPLLMLYAAVGLQGLVGKATRT